MNTRATMMNYSAAKSEAPSVRKFNVTYDEELK